MSTVFKLIMVIISVLPFVIFCILEKKLNLNRNKRDRQLFMPPLALIYCIVVMILFDKILDLINKLIKVLRQIRFLEALYQKADIYLKFALIILANIILLIGFLIIKGIVIKIMDKLLEKHGRFIDRLKGAFYIYDEDLDKWFIKPMFGQAKMLFSGLYWAAVIVTIIIFILLGLFPDWPMFSSVLMPSIGIIVIGEITSFLSGRSRQEFVEDVLGEDEESISIVNYGRLRDVFKKIFPDHLIFGDQLSTSGHEDETFRILREMAESSNKNERLIGNSLLQRREEGDDIDANYAKSTAALLEGNNILYCSPFYKDLSNYIVYPILTHLMNYDKCLVVVSTDFLAYDTKEWMESIITESVGTGSLWKTGILQNEEYDIDIGILKTCDLYNIELQSTNRSFFERVGFVFIIEPSRILSTSQMGLSILGDVCSNDKNKQVVYAACDRDCDGLVDALSHVLKIDITEVIAARSTYMSCTRMIWDADKGFMQHRILPNISRYLGMGTELMATARKYHVEGMNWLSTEKFPVMDMKWIAGQYFRDICNYANISEGQQSFDNTFTVTPNIWNCESADNQFLVVEDEFRNLFEITRLFGSRAKEQDFINVISENYLLRDYMIKNADLFTSDAKAIPTIVPDYTRTERNLILKLLIRMSQSEVSERDIMNEFEISGVNTDNVLSTIEELLKKHCAIDNPGIRIRFIEELTENGFYSNAVSYYSLEKDSQAREYASKLKNAYYVVEDEKDGKHFIGASLYGHVFQMFLPGQYATFAGKYYQIETISKDKGVIMRRAADHISQRRYYRQMRRINLSNWSDDMSMGGTRSISDIIVKKGFCDFTVSTDGYLEMNSYGNLKNAREVKISAIPERSYHNKSMIKLILPGASKHTIYTISVLLNEIFVTAFPQSYQFITAVCPNAQEPDELKHLTYDLILENADDPDEEAALYIIEDSEMDLGLLVAFERNINRFFEMISEFISWHEFMLTEKPEPPVPEGNDEVIFEEPPQEEKKKGFFRRIIDKVFKKKAAAKPEEQTEEPVAAPEAPEPEIEAEPVVEAEPEIEAEPVVEAEPETVYETGSNAEAEPEAEAAQQIDESADEVNDEQAEEPKAEENEPVILGNFETGDSEETDIEVEEDDAVKASETEQTEYQKHCFIKFGFDEVNPALDLSSTFEYLKKYGYDNNSLTAARTAQAYYEDHKDDPNRKGVHFCDFCGCELMGGEYEILSDGRERCVNCSATAIRTEEEFKELYKVVQRNMEIFFGIKINRAIKVRMTNARKIAKHYGGQFEPTPAFDGRALAFARSDKDGYSIYIENGSPRLSAAATLAHEMTHIWQYDNWDRKVIRTKYGKEHELEIYEGMAKWVQTQYLVCINEIDASQREFIWTMARNDEYGRGLRLYVQKYPITFRFADKVRTPFEENPPF